MDNGNENPTIGGMPSPNQPINQPIGQPIPQQAPQPFQNPPIQPAPTIQNQPTIQPIPNAPNNNSQGPKKKTGLIIGCSIGAVAVIALVAVLLITLLKNGEKTVTCTTSTTSMGITVISETSVRVKDGGISGGDVIVSANLKTLREAYKDYEKDIVDGITEQYRNHCTDHCTFNYNYIEGDSVKYTLQYDQDGVDQIVWTYGTENMSAQEIADKVQDALEGSGTTCVQH